MILEILPLGFGITFVVVVIFLVVLLFKSVLLVQQAEAVIVERMGKFDRVLMPGIHFVVPILEAPRQVRWSFLESVQGRKQYYRYTKVLTRIDLRESLYDFPKQNVITKDNVTMEINAILYYQITDPKAAVYEINDLSEAIEKLTQTTLRDIIGSMELDATLVSRDKINHELRERLDKVADKWGVKVNRVELQEVNPPEDIRHAMEKQMRAERDRRALMLESEGKKQAAILEAEGFRESQVLRAKGEAESQILIAEGNATARLTNTQAEAQAIEMIQRAVPNGDPLPYLIAMQYVKALPEMTKGKDDKLVVVPYEATALAGSLATMKTIFEHSK
jgi:regulator of protease activity HflC (stomatin/prohibitin superfamily)